MKVLLVDDDVGSLRGMQLALSMMRHECDAYSDPVKASLIYASIGNTYDLVIADIYMPGMNGFVLAEKIREHNPAAKIIFISGYERELREKRAVGENEILLQKPVDFWQLKQMADRVVAGDQAKNTSTERR
jgi:two-component SAPR family response regulator